MQNLLNPAEDMAQELKAPAKRADSGAAAAYEKRKEDNSTYTFADERAR